ncbi:MAG TPA: Gfo/Idh/MocA family oxidoreductase [Desulfomonilia bacterium]|nr:Gfo/Idh/MocA family oxidoreductase [Desulfomonilia bacterium]
MGAAMKVAIIGAARNHNGIGEYIAKYFKDNGAEVVCVLGTTEQSSRAAAANLDKYGIRAKAYFDFLKMINESGVEGVAIASPYVTHKEYIELCIDAGLHIFCEKPFISPVVPDVTVRVESMFARAQDKGIVMAMNSQWPFSLPCYEELCGRIDPARITDFTIRLSPLLEGPEMIPDSVPHALSLLYCAAGWGKIDGISFRKGDDSLLIRFVYLTEHTGCETVIELVREPAQPRTFAYGFNGRVARRQVELETYTLHLTYGDKTLKLEDPLGLSVRDFISAARSGTEPLLGRRHIVKTASMLRQIYAEYIRA